MKGYFIFMASLFSAGLMAGSNLSFCPPHLLGQAVYGGSGADLMFDLVPALDGGYLLGGNSDSMDGDKLSPHFGRRDYWVLRINQHGVVLWENSFGGSQLETLVAITTAVDGGFLLLGMSDSPADGVKTAPPLGDLDAWVVRLDSTGRQLWDRTYGGAASDSLNAAVALPDGGFLLAGRTGNPGPDGSHRDGWLVRIDQAGALLWERRFGGSGGETFTSLLTLPDGFLVGGISDSPPGESKTSPHYGGGDFWLVRVDAEGNAVWDRSYGGSARDELNAIQVDQAVGIVLIGSSASPADGVKKSPGFGQRDFWIVRLDGEGNIMSDHGYGGSANDTLRFAVEMFDGGFLLAGTTRSPTDGTKTSPNSLDPVLFDSFGIILPDYWLVRIDHSGEVLWDQTIGGPGLEDLRGVARTPEGGLLLGGYSTEGTGGFRTIPSLGGWIDIWIVNLGPEDCDQDGVPDETDECPGTSPGEFVVSNGCSLFQIVPPDGPWRNHGDFLRAVRRTVGDWLEAGWISRNQHGSLIREAARQR